MARKKTNNSNPQALREQSFGNFPAQKNPPQYLFRYFDPGGIAALERGRLRFKPPSQLNDPFEMKMPLVSRGTVHPLVKPGRVVHADSEAQDLFQELDATYGVLCLTEALENQLMWAHYGAAHYGFSVCFQTSHPSFSSLGDLHPVTYTSRRRAVRSGMTNQTFMNLMLSKSRAWAYEKEWRITTRLRECIQTRDGYYEKDFSLDCVNAIALGLRADDDLTRRVREIAQKHPHIHLRRFYLCSDKYRLIALPEDWPTPTHILTGKVPRTLVMGSPHMRIWTDAAVFFEE